MTVHLKVPRGVWGRFRADAMGRGRTAQAHFLAMLEVAYGAEAKVMAKVEVVKESKPVERVEVTKGKVFMGAYK